MSSLSSASSCQPLLGRSESLQYGARSRPSIVDVYAISKNPLTSKPCASHHATLTFSQQGLLSYSTRCRSFKTPYKLEEPAIQCKFETPISPSTRQIAHFVTFLLPCGRITTKALPIPCLTETSGTFAQDLVFWQTMRPPPYFDKFEYDGLEFDEMSRPLRDAIMADEWGSEPDGWCPEDDPPPIARHKKRTARRLKKALSTAVQRPTPATDDEDADPRPTWDRWTPA